MECGSDKALVEFVGGGKVGLRGALAHDLGETLGEAILRVEARRGGEEDEAKRRWRGGGGEEEVARR